MAQQKIIGLDLDGIIIDHTENKIRIARNFGFSFEPFEVVGDFFKKKIGSKEIHDKIQEIIYDDPVVSLTPPLIIGAKEGLDFLKQSGFPYFLISRRKITEPAISLLKKRNLWPTYFNESNAFFVITKEEKNEKAKELGVSIYIDDQPSVIEKLVDVPQKFLFDNYGVCPDSENYKKVRSWQEFVEAIKIL